MITLIEIHEGHVPSVQQHASHPDIGRMSMVPSPYPADGAAAWFHDVQRRRTEGTCSVFAVMLDEAFCGVVSVNDIRPDRRFANIDYWIAVPFQGRGLATEAVGLALAHASSVLKMQAFLSVCLATNLASARVLLKSGFRERESRIAGSGRFEGQTLRRFIRR